MYIHICIHIHIYLYIFIYIYISKLYMIMLISMLIPLATVGVSVFVCCRSASSNRDSKHHAGCDGHGCSLPFEEELNF